MNNKRLTLIAGPCSVDQNNAHEVEQIAKLPGVAGVRVVGLKSRTQLDPTGQGMGIDYQVFVRNVNRLVAGASLADLEIYPSVEIARSVHKATKCLVASEIMEPLVQMPLWRGVLGEGKFLAWNPAVNQLGWPVATMARFAKEQGWLIGLKNGKWQGETMEKTWIGMSTYTKGVQTVFIQRGVESANKGNYRNLPDHEAAKRVKNQTGCKMFFDPSHSYGPKLRDQIVAGVFEAMQMRINESEYLYDGVLIEVGHSQTDTDQHISIDELKELIERLDKGGRELR